MKILVPVFVALFFIMAIFAMSKIMCTAFPTLYPESVCND